MSQRLGNQHPIERIAVECRKLGQMKGEIWMADDFDTWPEDILASFDAWDYGDDSEKK